MKLSPLDQHIINVAKATLRMNDEIANIMGGMTKQEAREVLKKHGIKIDEALSRKRR